MTSTEDSAAPGDGDEQPTTPDNWQAEFKRIEEAWLAGRKVGDAHEAIKDTGESRTWPNFMSREGARGQEWNAWASDGGNRRFRRRVSDL